MINGESICNYVAVGNIGFQIYVVEFFQKFSIGAKQLTNKER